MLFAAEGGGFFSSSASGYSKGLTLLLFGQKNEAKPMRISPWNQYHLVDQESNINLQLASTKSRLSHRCPSFVCFRCSSTRLDAPSSLKVGPARQQDIQQASLVPNKEKDHTGIDNDDSEMKASLRSSLKKPANDNSVSGEANDVLEASGENGCDITGHTERRKVQWMDTCGSELVEIREFEPSEAGGSDDEFDSGSDRTCSCVIM